MLFSSIEFLYYFLPVVVGICFLLPQKARNGWLLVSSLVFYGWGEPRYVALMLLSIAAFYGLGLAMGRSKRPNILLLLGIALGMGLLGVFKYADFALENVNALLGLALPLPRLALPIGISFYTFQLVSYLFDVYWGRVPPQRSFVDFGCYVSMFPQLIAGPIVRYIDVASQLRSRRTTSKGLSIGLQRFVLGLGKKVLIANQLGAFVEAFRAAAQPSVLFYWLYAVGFSLHIYFDFSGYSDMAIGLGRIFGFRFPENFNYPYISASVQEFWRRWHISLSSWFRDYVYIPLGGSRVSRLKWLRNVLVVWLFTGLWHGAQWNFVVWGLYFAAFLMLEKFLPIPEKLPKALRHGYVLLVVAVSFVIFNGSGMGGALADLKAMFGLSGLPLCSAETLYYLRSYLVVFLMSIAGATPVVSDYVNRIPEKLRLSLTPLALSALLLLCTAYLVDGSFNPFLYFRF